MKLNDIASIIGAEPVASNPQIESVSIDTRTMRSDALFIALSGPNFDGNTFVAQAKTLGAAAAIVSKPVETDLPHLFVRDTRQALQALAAYCRSQVNIPVGALTGSCGKTSTKSMIGWVLHGIAPALVTQASYNNNIGVPLTLAHLNATHQYAILELGANHHGEIAQLTRLVQPTVAMILNVGAAHLEGFGSLEGVARAKGEIYEGLSPEGIAIVNIDDPFSPMWLENLNPNQVVTFGRSNQAMIRATKEVMHDNGEMSFTLNLPGNMSGKIYLPLLGSHQVSNALACSAMCHVFGVSLETIVQGLSSMPPVDQRLLRVKGRGGSKIIHDAYNANPTSVTAAIDVLAQCSGQQIFVLGDMLELGDNSKVMHAQMGEKAKSVGIDYFYTVGNLSQSASNAFGENGQHFETKQALLNVLLEQLSPEVTVLVKGSRGMKLEEVVKVLQAKTGMT